MSPELRTHIKSITSIVLGVAFIAVLIRFPMITKWTYIAMWVVVVFASFVMIYMWIYMAFEPKENRVDNFHSEHDREEDHY